MYTCVAVVVMMLGGLRVEGLCVQHIHMSILFEQFGLCVFMCSGGDVGIEGEEAGLQGCVCSVCTCYVCLCMHVCVRTPWVWGVRSREGSGLRACVPVCVGEYDCACVCLRHMCVCVCEHACVCAMCACVAVEVMMSDASLASFN